MDRKDIVNETLDENLIYGNYPKSISFNQLDYITNFNGEIKVNFIGRFENIEEDFEKIMNKIFELYKSLNQLTENYKLHHSLLHHN